MKTNKKFDIIFIQEPPWSFVKLIPSSLSKEEDSLVNTSNHPDWIIFSRSPTNNNYSPRVISYINICLSHLYFSLQKDIFNHRNICCFSFFNNGDIYFIINIYSDALQTTLRYLKDTEVNIQNMLVMASDFNIRESS